MVLMKIAHTKAKIGRTMLAKLCLGFMTHIVRMNWIFASRSRLNRSLICQNTREVPRRYVSMYKSGQTESTERPRENLRFECPDARGENLCARSKSVTVLLRFTDARPSNISRK